MSEMPATTIVRLCFHIMEFAHQKEYHCFAKRKKGTKPSTNERLYFPLGIYNCLFRKNFKRDDAKFVSSRWRDEIGLHLNAIQGIPKIIVPRLCSYCGGAVDSII